MRWDTGSFIGFGWKKFPKRLLAEAIPGLSRHLCVFHADGVFATFADVINVLLKTLLLTHRIFSLIHWEPQNPPWLACLKQLILVEPCTFSVLWKVTIVSLEMLSSQKSSPDPWSKRQLASLPRSWPGRWQSSSLPRRSPTPMKAIWWSNNLSKDVSKVTCFLV